MGMGWLQEGIETQKHSFKLPLGPCVMLINFCRIYSFMRICQNAFEKSLALLWSHQKVYLEVLSLKMLWGCGLQGRLTKDDIDVRMCKALSDLPTDQGLEAVDKFASANLDAVRSKTGFMVRALLVPWSLSTGADILRFSCWRDTSFASISI